MSNEERLKAAGWETDFRGAAYAPYRWTQDGIDWYTEDEALVVVLTAERDAAIARAERAEAQLDVRLPPGLFAEYTRLDLAWQSLVRDRDALRARAEAAEAMAASMLDVSPEDAHDVFVHGVELSAHYDDAEDMGALVRIRAALRAHAAKVSR